ncbi:rRNA maturation RNase YbeY [Thauera linaloolentis]|uniref:Endoribonuclease YbeY n=1 Tax=Thauera linaloolentis (strain DSM 12138 / JCM 21573 / CCUG 41526 / CIP 105981 / IAM 15112 / NBRC 102519 / 47Lol) TaxID=1123367 RepID=N6Z3L7_THAL4|nr:metalloprotease [Thauera linaloolentis 47Lol = DSM 12138]
MPKAADKPMARPRILAIDAEGKTTRVKAERLEIELGGGRKLLLAFPERAWGDLEIEAEGDSDDVVPMLSLQPGACNLMTLRVDLHHDMLPAESVESIDLPQSDSPPVLKLAVQKAVDGPDKASVPKKHNIRRWAQAALLRDAEVAVRLVGEAEGRELNRAFRGKDYATNVLTFVYGEGEEAHERGDGGGPLAGDLVLCVPVVLREAAEQGKTAEAHFAHLVVHGMLHLQGHDHENEAEALDMEKLETDILGGLGYADPYA